MSGETQIHSTKVLSTSTVYEATEKEEVLHEKFFRFVQAVLPGSLGGAARVLTGQPFDTVKVRLQIQEYDSKGVGLQYANSGDCLRKIVKQEGPMALYRGSLAPLVGNILLLSVHFPVFSAVRKSLEETELKSGRLLTNKSPLDFFKTIYFSGAMAGLAGSLVSTPVEHVRIKVQMKGSVFKGSVDCAKTIISEQGIRGMYKGFLPTTIRDFQGYGFFFYCYEVTLKYLKGEQEYLEKTATKPIYALTAGVAAGFGLWGSMFPIDVIKSKMQADNLGSPRFKSMIHCAKVIYANDGLKGFWRGITPTLIRAIPVNAAIFLTVETSKALLNPK